MANETNIAQSGTQPTGCPSWDNMGNRGDLPPFFRPTEEMKRGGFEVTFLTDGPRKETKNNFDSSARDLWFDILYDRKENDLDHQPN